MKTAIIGAGNMGGSIARGLAKGTIIPAKDRKSTRLNSSHIEESRMPSSA